MGMNNTKEKQKGLIYGSMNDLNWKKKWKNQNKNLAISTLTECSGISYFACPFP